MAFDGVKKKKKITVIAMVVILVVGAVVGTIVTVRRNNSKQIEINTKKAGGKKSAIIVTTAVVIIICKYTDFRRICEETLQRLGIGKIPRELMTVSFSAAVEGIQGAIESSYPVREAAKDPMAAKAVDLCKELLDCSIEDLKRALDRWSIFDRLSENVVNLRVWLSGAVTYQETCLDAFENTTGDSGARMRQLLEMANMLTRNSLAMLDGVSFILENSPLRSDPRRVNPNIPGQGIISKPNTILPIPGKNIINGQEVDIPGQTTNIIPGQETIVPVPGKQTIIQGQTMPGIDYKADVTVQQTYTKKDGTVVTKGGNRRMLDDQSGDLNKMSLAEDEEPIPNMKPTNEDRKQYPSSVDNSRRFLIDMDRRMLGDQSGDLNKMQLAKDVEPILHMKRTEIVIGDGTDASRNKKLTEIAIGDADTSRNKKLTEISIGDEADTPRNKKLTEISIGDEADTSRNKKLTEISIGDEADNSRRSLIDVDRRMLDEQIGDLNKMQLPSWADPSRRSLIDVDPKTLNPNAVVAQDGSGQFKTITEAVNTAPQKKPEPFVILIKAGTYKENVMVPRHVENVVFLGEGAANTKITGNKNFVDGVGTYQTATVAVNGDGFIAKDIWFENTAGPEKHQAVALRVSADMAIFHNCVMDGFQDTLYAHSYRQFYRQCNISGTIDFVFGDAAAVFQDCKLIVKKPMANQECMVTAQGRKDRHSVGGLVFQGCTVTADPTANPPPKAFLGRPWKEFSRTVFMQSFIDQIIAPEGWAPWTGTFAQSTCYYAEFNNKGPGSNTGMRAKWLGVKRSINPKDAERFTPGQYIQGDGWIPQAGVPYDSGMMKA